MILNTDGRREQNGTPRKITTDLGLKRAVSIVLGTVLVVIGLRRRSLFGAGLAFVGGWLISRNRANRNPTDFRGKDVVEQGWARFTSVGEPIIIEQSVTIEKPRDELYEMWNDAETVAQILAPVVTVENQRTSGRWLWTASTPIGKILTWETEISENRPGEFLYWKSVEGRLGEGSVRFQSAPADRGTEATLRLRFSAPGGVLGNAIVRRIGLVPETLASKALYRFKSLAETGEIPTLEANPSARGSGDLV